MVAKENQPPSQSEGGFLQRNLRTAAGAVGDIVLLGAMTAATMGSGFSEILGDTEEHLQSPFDNYDV